MKITKMKPETRVWAFNGDKGQYSRITMDPFCAIDIHSHDFCEINIITNGKGIHCLESNEIVAEKGDVFVIPYGISHGYRTIGTKKDLEVLDVLLTKQFFKHFAEVTKLHGYRILFEIEPQLRQKINCDLFLKLNEEQLGKILKLYYECSEYSVLGFKPSDYIISNAVSLQMCALLCNYAEEYFDGKKAKERPQDKAIITSMEYMKNHYGENISVEDLANISFISKASYERHFKMLCECTPMQYLQNCRLEAARSMLKNTDKGCDEISFACGFYDSSHMTKLFKKKYEITPYQFRKEENNDNE